MPGGSGWVPRIACSIGIPGGIWANIGALQNDGIAEQSTRLAAARDDVVVATDGGAKMQFMLPTRCSPSHPSFLPTATV